MKIHYSSWGGGQGEEGEKIWKGESDAECFCHFFDLNLPVNVS